MDRTETLRLEEVAPELLLVTLDRPQAANALNTRMMRDLEALWTRLTAMPGAVRCVVLTGAGERAFCAGADLKERDGLDDTTWVAQHEILERAWSRLLECPIPVIAAVNGAAFGGGLELALACDFAYAVRDARFGFPEVVRGIMPGAGGTQFLPRAVGERRAKEIILGGQAFGAAEALEWGIVNRLCERDALLPEALATARSICANAPLSVRQAKRAIHHGLQLDLTNGLNYEIEAYNRLVPTADRREGVRAFNEKRKPDFIGR
jgi:enoyl-CoA hydratase